MACDAIGREAASTTAASVACSSGDADVDDDARAGLVVCTALADSVRVSVVGDLSTRPRVCASVYGGMVAMFLNGQ
jgi:hypothetical protein